MAKDGLDHLCNALFFLVAIVAANRFIAARLKDPTNLVFYLSKYFNTYLSYKRFGLLTSNPLKLFAFSILRVIYENAESCWNVLYDSLKFFRPEICYELGLSGSVVLYLQ